MFKSLSLISTLLVSNFAFSDTGDFSKWNAGVKSINESIQKFEFNKLQILNNQSQTEKSKDSETQVDVQVINQVIEEIIAHSLQVNPVIKEISLKIQPSLNLDEGKVAGEFNAKVATTTWAKDVPSEIGLIVATHANQINSDQKESVIELHTQLETPILSLIRYIFTINLGDSSDQIDKEYHEIALKYSKAQDVNELYEITKDFLKVIENRAAHDEDSSNFIKGLIILDREKSSDGKVQSFEIHSTKPMFERNSLQIDFRHFYLFVADNKISAGIEMAKAIENLEFEHFVTDAKKYLGALQNREEKYVSWIQGLVRDYIEYVKSIISE